MKILLILVVFLLLAACTPKPAEEQGIPLVVGTEKPMSSTSVPLTSTTLDEKVISIVVNDLSIRVSIKPEMIRVLSSESTLWADSSLGCPRPEEVYIQGKVSGFRILLEAGGQIYEYHTDTNGHFIQCEMPADLPEFPVTPGDIQDGKPWMPVN